MAKMTWREKMEKPASTERIVARKPFSGFPAGASGIVPTPLEIDEAVRAIPAGELCTVVELRDQLAKKHGVEFTCPLTTGIFLRIVSEVALEDMADGRDPAPFWRVVDPKSPLAKKLTCGPEFIIQQRQAEAK